MRWNVYGGLARTVKRATEEGEVPVNRDGMHVVGGPASVRAHRPQTSPRKFGLKTKSHSL